MFYKSVLLLVAIVASGSLASPAQAQWWKTVDRWLVDFDKQRIQAVKEIDRALVDFDKSRIDAFDKVSDRLAKFERDVRNLSAAGISEELWGQAGRLGYVSAAKIMNSRSGGGVALSEKMKAHLRPHYGGLVDRVRIHWGVTPLDKWVASEAKKIYIEIEGGDTAGQTFGYDIYIRQNKGAGDYLETLHLMAHELAHSKQFEGYSKSLSNFGYHYFKNYKKAGLNYERNRLEVEAENESNLAMECACSSQGVFGIKADGKMYYYHLSGLGGDKKPGWQKVQEHIGTGWNFKQVFGGPHNTIYGVKPDGKLYFYRFNFNHDGIPKWEVVQKHVGSGWNFKHVIATSQFGSDACHIYGIKENGDVFYYQLADVRTAEKPSWRVTQVRIAGGWNYKQMFAGDNGAIYGITDEGRLDYFTHTYNSDNKSSSWRTQKGMGNKWSFNQLFALTKSTVCGIKGDGKMYHYNHKGPAGKQGWGTVGEHIGTGWAFKQVFSCRK